MLSQISPYCSRYDGKPVDAYLPDEDNKLSLVAGAFGKILVRQSGTEIGGSYNIVLQSLNLTDPFREI
jgi:hypothetical protein